MKCKTGKMGRWGERVKGLRRCHSKLRKLPEGVRKTEGRIKVRELR
jgi:hypothetical protein